jgi:hypothetical protein
MSIATAASESGIWLRVIHPERGDLPLDAARYFLTLTFDPADIDRMHELAVKNQEGVLTAVEQEELRNFRQVGLQIDLLRSKARQALQSSSTAT